MADPAKLVQIMPKTVKQEGFNLVTENVTAIHLEDKQIEIELLAYDGKTVLLEVSDEALEDLHRIKLGDGATLRVIEVEGKRVVQQFRIRSKDPNIVKVDAALMDLKDSHWLNRKYAVEVLGELRSAEAVDELVVCLEDDVGDVRNRAYEALIKIGAPSASKVIPLLVAEDEELRQNATEILRKIGKPAVEPLATALVDADAGLKKRIMKVLDRMGYKPKDA
ncbi:MAG: HEAT repeat domain-containing protein [Nitrospirae bacterium]|nr:HEAT repeat domain-containing protein [Nitrospirota bacterium]MDA1303807.1 HEAT repeat domain-containing protein [Nitrospirota bacterium]